MVNITYIEHSGVKHQVTAQVGDSLMELATNNLIEGIDGDCGGSLSCATCHCYIDESWIDVVGPAGSEEQAMIDEIMEVRSGSRLGCQVKVTEEMDGLVVRLPGSQH